MRTLLLLCLLAAPAAAQDGPPVRGGLLPHTITVMGEATVAAPPDRARLRFGVETEGTAPEETFQAHEQEVQAVLTAVRRLGIPDRWIQLEWVGLNETPDRRTRYVAMRFVVVTTDSLALVPTLTAAVVDAGADHLAGLEYFLEEDDRYEDEALQAAFARARAKAERLARAAGGGLGPVVTVAEQGVQPPMPIPVLFDRMQMDRAESTAGAYSTGQSEVRATVVVTFTLEAP